MAGHSYADDLERKFKDELRDDTQEVWFRPKQMKSKVSLPSEKKPSGKTTKRNPRVKINTTIVGIILTAKIIGTIGSAIVARLNTDSNRREQSIIAEENNRRVNAFLNKNSIYSNEQTDVLLIPSEFNKAYGNFKLDTIYKWCNEHGSITMPELIQQLRYYGTISKDDVLMLSAPTAKIFLRKYISEDEQKIIIYERFIQYILSASKSMNDSQNDEKCAALLNSLKTEWERLNVVRNVYSNKKYLEELQNLVRKYDSDLAANSEVTIKAFIECTQGVTPPPIQINSYQDNNVIYDVDTIVARNDFPLCEKVEIDYTITASDYTLSLIQEHLQRDRFYITADEILKQTKVRYPDSHQRFLGDYDATPQLGETLKLRVLAELPYEEQVHNIKSAFIKYLSSKGDLDVKSLLHQWNNKSLSIEEREKIWQRIFQKHSEEFKTFGVGMLNATRNKYSLPSEAFLYLVMELGLYDWDYLLPDFDNPKTP